MLLFGYDSCDPDSDLKHFAESKVKFDSLTLQSCEHVSELPTVVTSLELNETILDNYEIDGLKIDIGSVWLRKYNNRVFVRFIFGRLDHLRLQNN